MQNLRELVRSPHHLMVFEAAARHGSFTRAAGELNVTQPAVSLAVRQLEETLGVPLFRRLHRAIALTEAGERLYRDVSDGFRRMADTARQIRQRRDGPHVTLSVSTAFANYWMVPRLAIFHRDCPGIDLRLQTTDKDLDLDEEGVSLGVRRGLGAWPGYEAATFATEVLRPLASPAFLAANGTPSSLEELAAARLIHLEEPFRPRPTWRSWFEAHGTSFQEDGAGLRLNDYALVLQAAMAGEGIALGWRHVTESLIAQSLLAPVGRWALETENAFYLVWSDRTRLSDTADAVRRWVLSPARSRDLAPDGQSFRKT